MYKHVKRLLDIVIAILVMCISFPLMVGIVVFLIMVNHGKPFFYQLRPGLKGKIFKIIKFKTMNDKRDEHGELLPDELRITWLGHWIRKLSLDEIPQMINVLKGDMSLVGPRPLLVEYLPLYSPEQARRHDVKPGITGWAQINGRNAITWDQKFKFDVYYVDHISFGLDIKILFKTVLKVLKREGISDGVSQTMEKFKGNKV